MEAVIPFLLGITSLIFLILIRKTDNSSWSAYYWGVFTLGGLISIWAPQYCYILIAVIPTALRISTRFWFLQQQKWESLFIPVPLIILYWILITFTGLLKYVLPAFLLIEVYITIRYFSNVFRTKGTGWFIGSGSKLEWYRFFLLINLILLIGVAGTYFNELNSISFIVMQYSMIGVGLLAIIKYSNSRTAFSPFFEEHKYAKSTLDQKEKFEILQKLEFQIREGFHLDSNASLTGLAKKVGTSTHQLSQVINEAKEMSFFELMAFHRVQESKKLLKSPKTRHYKIEEIAEQVGYLSKSAFNTSFKKITGKTPSEFRENDVREDKVERREHREIRDSSTMSSTFGDVQMSMLMFSNFLKVYLRNLKRNRIFAFINLSGLILGFTSCLLIFLFVADEFSYDKFHNGSENIYRITLQASNPQTRTPHPMAQALVNDFPEVVSAVTLTPLYGPGLTLQSRYIRNPENNTMFKIPDGFAADSTFFDVFDFELIAGDEKSALKSPGSVVITEEMATRFFGTTDVLGKTLEAAEDGSSGLISGVMKNPPKNSHFHPQYIIPYASLKADPGNARWMSWSDPGHFNYIKMADGTDHKKLEAALSEWVLKYSEGVEKELVDAIQQGFVSFGVQPIEDIHLQSQLRWELETNSSITYVYILIASIVFILIIISINFINLYTARSFERAQEVGIRKTLGASNNSISTQFIGESILTCLFALLVAFGMGAIVLDSFNQLAAKSIEISELFSFKTIISGLGLVLLIGAISGLYPSLTIGKIKSIEVLKGKFINQRQGAWKRNLLITVQFTVSAIMIFGSIIILNQVKFLESQSVGFNQEQLVVLELNTNNEQQSRETIKNELLKIPGVIAAGGISNVPGGQFNQNDLFHESNPFDRVPASELWVDFDGLQVLGIELESGRWFDKSSKLDSSQQNFIINQTAYDLLNLNEPNSQIMWGWESGDRKGTVVGVMKDFNFKSLHEPVKPIVVTVGLQFLSKLMIRIDGQNVPETIKAIEAVHNKFDSEFAPEITFLDDQLNNLYNSERRAFQIFNIFSVIALILAAMGLLGIAYLVITQRTKEIGIRKVLGARIPDLLWMENQSFIKIIGVATIIGLPTAFYIMKQWLSEFAYATEIGLVPFAITTVILILVAVASVSFAILRTITKNPSHALRYE